MTRSRARFAWLIAGLLGILVGACSPDSGPSGSAIPSPSVAPIASVGPTTSTQPVAAATATPRPTPTPVLSEPCSTDAVLSVSSLLGADPECLRHTLTVRGWLDAPPGMGWEGPSVEPAWLYYPVDNPLSSLWAIAPVGPDHFCPDPNGPCPWFFLHIAPGSNVTLGVAPGWVLVTGHVDDPASPTCHYEVTPGDSTFIVNDAEAVAQCRSQFVVESIGAAPAQ